MEVPAVSRRGREARISKWWGRVVHVSSSRWGTEEVSMDTSLHLVVDSIKVR